MDEKELLKVQIKSYDFYAGLIERAVGGAAGARLPRWDEQRAIEYRALAEQLRQRLAELEAEEAAASATPAGAVKSTNRGSIDNQASDATHVGDAAPAATLP